MEGMEFYLRSFFKLSGLYSYFKFRPVYPRGIDPVAH